MIDDETFEFYEAAKRMGREGLWVEKDGRTPDGEWMMVVMAVGDGAAALRRALAMVSERDPRSTDEIDAGGPPP